MVKKLLVGAVLVHAACAAVPNKATSKQARVTGSHILHEDNNNLEAKSISPIRVYGERDLQNSGHASTGEQINRLDVSAPKKLSSGTTAPK